MRPTPGWKSLLRPPEDDDRVIEAARQLPTRGVVRAFWPHLRPYRGRLAVLLALLAVGPAVAVAEINLFRLVVDDVLVPADLSPLLVLALLYVGLNVLSALASGADDYLSTSVSQHFLLGLRTDLFRHVLALPQAAHDRRRVGDLVSRLTSDASAVERFMFSGVSSGVTAVWRIVFYTVALLWLSWELTALSLLVVPALWFVASRFARLLKVVSRERMRRGGSASAVAEEHLGAVPLVQAYGREDDAVASFHRQNQGIVGAELAASRARSLFTPAVDLAELIAVLGVIGFGTWALSTTRLTLGGLLAFLALLTQLYSPLRDLTRLIPSLFAATAGAERILELRHEEPLHEAPGAANLHAVRGAIGLHNVTVRYPGATHDAVRGLDLDIAPGEVVALVGPSGAGKSTLLRLLPRLMDPTEGTVTIDGHDLRDVAIRSLRTNVSFVLQETLLLDTSVRENIAFARPTASNDEVVSAARAAAAHEFIQALPAGYETTVGQRGRGLSGGQRQRVAIARAILRDAPILILDEPTTGLDEKTARRVLGPLRELVRDRTTILVTHDPVALQVADRVVRIEAGRVVEDKSTITEPAVVA
jgi:subfamily B ATP-binding cassette protein MsbA